MKIKENLKKSLIGAAKPLYNSLPILIGVILLVSLISSLVSTETIANLFKGNILLDSFIGSFLGSIFTGNPVTSFILGGELLSQGVSLFAVTAFLVAWVTVGIVQLPAESMLLGKRFSISRNIISFIFSIIVAVITVVGVGLL